MKDTGTMRRFLIPVLAVLLLPASAIADDQWVEIWRTPGFDRPESVSWDETAKVFYVSNLGTDPTSKDGNGFISRLKADGSVDALRWVTGLDAPKGTQVVGDRLWVSDIDRLVEIDTTKGAILQTYPVPGAQFLNDVAAAKDGRIFVSDTFGNAIYVLKDGVASEFIRGGVVGPNGLVIDGNTLFVAELGDASQGYAKLKPGRVKTIDLDSKKVSDFGGVDPIGGLDGIERGPGKGVFVTDNPGGRLLRVRADKPTKVVMTLKPGAADFELLLAQQTVVVPQMQENEVVAYQRRKE